MCVSAHVKPSIGILIKRNHGFLELIDHKRDMFLSATMMIVVVGTNVPKLAKPVVVSESDTNFYRPTHRVINMWNACPVIYI